MTPNRGTLAPVIRITEVTLLGPQCVVKHIEPSRACLRAVYIESIYKLYIIESITYRLSISDVPVTVQKKINPYAHVVVYMGNRDDRQLLMLQNSQFKKRQLPPRSCSTIVLCWAPVQMIRKWIYEFKVT